MIPLEYIVAARLLANYDGDHDLLARAVSTAYYAIFRAICIAVADEWFGADGVARNSIDWRHMCRGVNHGDVLRACKNKTLLRMLPPIFSDLANIFIKLHLDRNLADYDPHTAFVLELVLRDIDEAERVILGFEAVESAHRRVFLSRVVYPDRK